MMAERVLIFEEAAFDLDQGVTFYEAQANGLGSYFFDSLLSDIESLRLSAGVHEVSFGFHCMLARRFPFAVYYEYNGRIATVVAILDMRSNPAWIRNQLGLRS